MFLAVDEFGKSYRFVVREAVARVKHMGTMIRWYGWYRSHGELPEKITNILFLCKGNICRSPLAEVYFRSKLKSDCGITVRSAGLDTTCGKPAHHFARQVAEHHGLTLEPHVTAQMVREMVEEADLILVMEVAQLVSLLKLCPRLKGKVFVLSEFSNNKRMDIADPFSGTIEDFEKCFEVIRNSCDSLANKMQV